MAGFLIPLIALAAGAALQGVGAEQSRRAMNKRTSAELERQRKFRQQGSEQFAQSLQGSTREVAESRLQEGRQQSEAQSQQLQSIPLGGNEVKTDAVSQVRDSAETNRSNKARAAVMSYPWWTLNQAIKDIRANQELSRIGNFAQGSQAVLPLELQDASHKGDTLSGIGSLIGTLGSLYGMGSAIAPNAAFSAGRTVGSTVAPVVGSGAYNFFGR